MTVAYVPVRAADREPVEFGHVVLLTADPQPLIGWYRTVLDMDVVMQSDRLAFLTYDGAHHRLVVATRPGDDSVPSGRVDHIAFRCRDHRHLVRRYRSLRRHGIVPARASNHGLITSLYYDDPDGNRIELYADNFASTDALNRWLATGAFDRDPIGCEIDFEPLATRLEAGVPATALFAPPQDAGQRD